MRLFIWSSIWKILVLSSHICILLFIVLLYLVRLVKELCQQFCITSLFPSLITMLAKCLFSCFASFLKHVWLNILSSVMTYIIYHSLPRNKTKLILLAIDCNFIFGTNAIIFCHFVMIWSKSFGASLCHNALLINLY